MVRRAALAVSVALALSPAAAAGRGTACGPRAEIVRVLAETYGEAMQARALQSATAMIEIWASASSGTWTILLVQSSGIACVVASGQSWLAEPVALAPGERL